MPTQHDPVAGYLETLERLRSQKRWTTNTHILRFVALSLGTTDIGYERLEQTAETLKEGARRFSPMRGQIRYPVAALILRRELDPEPVLDRVEETLDQFKAYDLPKRGVGPTLAALMLALRNDAGPPPADHLERLKSIYRRWRKERSWLTNSGDLPTAALHASGDRDVDSLNTDIEQVYSQLRSEGFSSGNQLQLVSHLLSMDPRGIHTAAPRFSAIAAALKEADEPVRPRFYDEIAILALTNELAVLVVDQVLQYRDRLRAAKRRPSKSMAFSLAVGIVLADDAQDAEKKAVGDLAALKAIREIIEAQQAAMAAVAAQGAAAGAAAG